MKRIRSANCYAIRNQTFRDFSSGKDHEKITRFHESKSLMALQIAAATWQNDELNPKHGRHLARNRIGFHICMNHEE